MSIEEWAAENAPVDDFESQRRARAAEARVKELSAQNKRLHDELDLAEQRYDLAMAIQEPRHAVRIEPTKRKANDAVGCIIGSDWHIEERVDPKTINGKNEYTPEIAVESAKAFFRNGLALVQRSRLGDRKKQLHPVAIDTIVCAFLGDMITGYLIEEMVENNWLSPTEAILLWQDLAVEGIKYLLAHGDAEKIVIPCCYGNHGRTNPRKKIVTAAKNSFEWMAYHNVAKMFADEKRVEFIIADGAHLYLDVLGHTIRFHHGDDLKYYGGVGGLSIPLRKATHEWAGFKPAELTVVGHWHQFVDYGFAIVNGSLIGFNAYALSIKARYEPPRQAFFLIEREYGKTLVAPIKIRKGEG